MKRYGTVCYKVNHNRKAERKEKNLNQSPPQSIMLLELFPDDFFLRFTPQELSSFLMRVSSNLLYFL